MDAQDTETPKIAEKVRFWEEQDRINQELIPRVIKQNELLTAHIEGHESASTQMAALEGRLTETIQSETARAVEAADAAGQHAIEEADRKISESEAKSAIAVASARRQALLVSGISLAVAAGSLIFALVS